MSEPTKEELVTAKKKKFSELLALRESENLTKEQLIDIFEQEYGALLSTLLEKEWTLTDQQKTLEEWEAEHSNSLALLIENESQKVQLKELNAQLTESSARYGKDLKMAAEVQKSFFFSLPPQTNNYDVAFHYQPCASVSGDFYDFYLDNNSRLTGAVLGDVSGHGIASSLLTVLAKPIFHRVFKNNPGMYLGKVLDAINKKLIEGRNSFDHYLTTVLLRFNDDCVEYTNGGHPDILLKSAKSGNVKMVRPIEGSVQGSIIGIALVDEPHKTYKFPIHSNDIIVVYSDAFNECKNSKNEQFGIERIMEILKKADNNATAQEVLDDCISQLKAFSAKETFDDDLTVMILKKK